MRDLSIQRPTHGRLRGSATSRAHDVAVNFLLWGRRDMKCRLPVAGLRRISNFCSVSMARVQAGHNPLGYQRVV